MSDDPTPPPWLGDALSDPTVPASTDALRGVLSRHRRRQARVLGLGTALVLVAGAVGGFLIGRQGGAGSTQVASGTAPTAAQAAAAANGGGFAAPLVGGAFGAATQVLVRDATDGTRIRLYRQQSPLAKAMATGCAPQDVVLAEVSDDQVAGQAAFAVFADLSGILHLVSAEVVGAGQPQPILEVVAHTAGDVAKVTLSTSYGTDSAAPTSDGWVALALRLPADFQAASAKAPADGGVPKGFMVPDGTVTAASSSGTTVASDPVTDIQGIPKSCLPTPPVECGRTYRSGGAATGAVTTSTAPPGNVNSTGGPVALPGVPAPACVEAPTTPPTTG